ncbi:unnamed protein product [Blepharisma stoltei]|uniref:Uncharacterized protein n=1 Tax=Blepharisma stoltei TaxID=1481888 RepID=A0AAU9JKP2_9CILI|nr:unnamed protein product [Blepharisma stoltei]
MNHSKFKPSRLNYQERLQRGGVKYFDNHKNLNSPEFALAVDITATTSLTPEETTFKPLERHNHGMMNETKSSIKTRRNKGILVVNDDLQKLKEKLRMKDIELDLLKQEEKRSQYSQEPLIRNERNSNEIDRTFDNGIGGNHKKPFDADRSFDYLLNSKKSPELDRSFENKSYDRRARDNRSLSPVPTNIIGYNTPSYKNPVDLLSLAWHPAFKQPLYTKNNPKVHNLNPITGFIAESHSRESPTVRRGMAEYGNSIIGNGSPMKNQYV